MYDDVFVHTQIIVELLVLMISCFFLFLFFFQSYVLYDQK